MRFVSAMASILGATLLLLSYTALASSEPSVTVVASASTYDEQTIQSKRNFGRSSHILGRVHDFGNATVNLTGPSIVDSSFWGGPNLANSTRPSKHLLLMSLLATTLSSFLVMCNLLLGQVTQRRGLRRHTVLATIAAVSISIIAVLFLLPARPPTFGAEAYHIPYHGKAILDGGDVHILSHFPRSIWNQAPEATATKDLSPSHVSHNLHYKPHHTTTVHHPEHYSGVNKPKSDASRRKHHHHKRLVDRDANEPREDHTSEDHHKHSYDFRVHYTTKATPIHAVRAGDLAPITCCENPEPTGQ